MLWAFFHELNFDTMSEPEKAKVAAEIESMTTARGAGGGAAQMTPRRRRNLRDVCGGAWSRVFARRRRSEKK